MDQQPSKPMLTTAKLDRVSHLYYLSGKEVGAVEWYRNIKAWIQIADQTGTTILKQDDDLCLLYVIDQELLIDSKPTENEQDQKKRTPASHRRIGKPKTESYRTPF